MCLFIAFSRHYPMGHALHQATYHAVSAYVNCGFSLFSDDLIAYQGDWLVNLTVITPLLVAGGIGFVVQHEVYSKLRGSPASRSLTVLAIRDALTDPVQMVPPASFVIKDSDILVAIGKEEECQEDEIDRLPCTFKACSNSLSAPGFPLVIDTNTICEHIVPMGLSNSGEGGYPVRADGRLEYVQFSRGLAIIGIVLFHFLRRLDLMPWLSRSIEVGGSAVHLFFFLSGFSLALSYRAYHSSFYIRRFLGVLLPYYLLVTMVFLATLALPIYPADGWLAYLSHIFLFKMFDNELIGTYGGHLWFVSSIIEFYLVFPLLFVCLKRTGKWTFMTVGICVSTAYWVALYHYGVYSEYIYKDFFLQFLWEFAMGMVCADLFKRRGFKFWEVKPSITFAVFVASVTALFLLHVETGTFGRIFNDIPLSLMFISVSIMAHRLVGNWLPIVLRIVLWIGYISYSLYLIHMLCFALVMYFAKVQSPSGIEIAAAAAIALASAPLFHIAMDRLQRSLRSNLRPVQGFGLTNIFDPVRQSHTPH